MSGFLIARLGFIQIALNKFFKFQGICSIGYYYDIKVPKWNEFGKTWVNAVLLRASNVSQWIMTLKEGVRELYSIQCFPNSFDHYTSYLCPQ